MRDVEAELVAYLRGRGAEAAYGHAGYWVNHLLPGYGGLSSQDVDALARYLLQDTAFEALRLGSWLGTPDGQIVAAAVEHGLPVAYRPYAELFERALVRAAELQREGQRAEAMKSLVVVGAAVLVGVGLWFAGRSA